MGKSLNKLKDEDHGITSIDARKAIGRTINLFNVKSSRQIKNRRNYYKLIKSIYKMEKWACLVSPLLFNTILEILESEVTQEKEIKSITTGMEKPKILY